MGRRFLMDKPVYTVIPDTSDADYWELKTQNSLTRSSTFVPRDKQLHQQLKEKAWKEIQSRQSRNRKVAQ